MFQALFQKMGLWHPNGSQPGVGCEIPKYTRLKVNLLDNMTDFQGDFDHCSDFISREFTVAGRRAAVLMMDNMVEKVTLSDGVLTPLSHAVPPSPQMSAEEEFVWIRDDVMSTIDIKEIFTFEESMTLLMSGFVLFLLDGADKALSIGLQGFPYRTIQEPNIETVLRGSREGFVEALRINMSMVRRRIKNPNLKFEIINIGKESKTDICVAYIKGVAADSVVAEVMRRLNKIGLHDVLASGNIQPFLQDHPYSIFSTVGTTERPDTLCGKLNEGRVGIIVDGTPVALLAPFLLIENFQNMDDYAVSFMYATFTRILKYLAFIISILLPALYVAVGSFHEELLPTQLLHTLAQSEAFLPFNMVFEAILMQAIYEILREAGLRLPKQFGFAITIVGALIVGQAAVSAGLIGAPMVIIVALTATTSLVVPSLYEPSIVLRFAFIILAGMTGLYTLTLGVAFVIIHLCSLKSYEIPFTAPLSPTELYSMRDVVFRAPMQVMVRKHAHIQDLPGSDVDKEQE